MYILFRYQCRNWFFFFVDFDNCLAENWVPHFRFNFKWLDISCIILGCQLDSFIVRYLWVSHIAYAVNLSGTVCQNWKLRNYTCFSFPCLSSYVFVLQNYQNHGSVAPAKNSRLSPLPPERAGFNYGIGETVDIPIDATGVSLNFEIVN